MFDFSKEEKQYNELISEQALKTLEILEVAKTENGTFKHRGVKLALVYRPLVNFAIRQSLFVLNVDVADLIKELGNTKIIKDTFQDLTADDETNVAVDNEAFEQILSMLNKKVSEQIDQLDETSAENTSEEAQSE